MKYFSIFISLLFTTHIIQASNGGLCGQVTIQNQSASPLNAFLSFEKSKFKNTSLLIPNSSKTIALAIIRDCNENKPLSKIRCHAMFLDCLPEVHIEIRYPNTQTILFSDILQPGQTLLCTDDNCQPLEER